MMSDDHHDDLELSSLLRGLPRETVGDDFAAGIVDAVRRPKPFSRRPLIGLAATLAIAAAIGMVVLRPVGHAPAPSHPSAARIKAITQEYARLEAEWTALERLRATARPVVYLGATEQADLVLDLEQLARWRAGSGKGRAPRSSGIQPVAFTHGERHQ